MNINVTDIKNGFPGISTVAAAQLYETFEVCMHHSGHGENVTLTLEGISQESITLHWVDEYNDQKARTYQDMAYTTEHGAVCLSVMLTTILTPYTIIERSRRGTGFDYWLGEKDSVLFQKKARLEVSGIYSGDDATIRKRYSAKVEQTSKSDHLMMPAYISIVEFSTPKALFTHKQ